MPNGKICYLEIPSTEIESSARFYQGVFRWPMRTRGDGARSFDDSTGAVSGAFVTERKAHKEGGVVAYVQVDDIAATLLEVVKYGGSVHTQRTELGPGGDAYALILDSCDNLLGLYQEPRRS